MKISVCSPIMNEQECIREFYSRLKIELENVDWELILVDDGSTDNTVNIVQEICRTDPRVKFIELARNHGKSKAATTAFLYSSGDYIVYMDTDLQDPVGRILEFCDILKSGYNVVYGIRKERNDKFITKIQSKIFWFILNKYTNLSIPVGLSVMRGFDKSFKNRLLSLKEHNRFLEGLFFITSGNMTTLEIEHHHRFAGESKYNFKKKIELAANAIFDFSDRPLIWAVKLGIILLSFSMIYFILILSLVFLGYPIAQGWISIIGILTFFSGLQVLLIGGVGLYVGKSYLETKKRPNVSISKVFNLDGKLRDIRHE